MAAQDRSDSDFGTLLITCGERSDPHQHCEEQDFHLSIWEDDSGSGYPRAVYVDWSKMSVYVYEGYGLAVFEFGSLLSDQVQIITFGYKQPTASTGPSDTLPNVVSITVGTGFLVDPAHISNESQLTSIKLYERIGGVLQFAEDPTVVPFGRGSTSPAPQVSVIVKKTTGVVGRHARGRMYLPACFLQQTEVNEVGIISSTPITRLQSVVTALLADATTNDLPLQVLHESSALVPTPITNLVVENLIGTQRRRLR